MSIIPRAKVKELPFAFAEDLKGEKSGCGGTKESGDFERGIRSETRGKREEKKEKGVVGVDRYLPDRRSQKQ